jgi:hypothetical protein
VAGADPGPQIGEDGAARFDEPGQHRYLIGAQRLPVRQDQQLDPAPREVAKPLPRRQDAFDFDLARGRKIV